MTRGPHRAFLIVAFAGLGASAASAQNPAVTISVDANANRRPIDPRIYGIAHPPRAVGCPLADLSLP